MKNRSSSEIMDAILRSVKSRGSHTRIMYSAYLSYGEVKEYLELLQKREMIEYDSGTQFFKVTEKGMKYMKSHDERSMPIPEDRTVMPKELEPKPRLSKN